MMTLQFFCKWTAHPTTSKDMIETRQKAEAYYITVLYLKKKFSIDLQFKVRILHIKVFLLPYLVIAVQEYLQGKITNANKSELWDNLSHRGLSYIFKIKSSLFGVR